MSALALPKACYRTFWNLSIRKRVWSQTVWSQTSVTQVLHMSKAWPSMSQTLYALTDICKVLEGVPSEFEALDASLQKELETNNGKIGKI